MKRQLLEWVALAASVLIVLAVTGFLASVSVRGETPPDPVVTVIPEQGRMGAAGWIVPATIENVGTDEASALQVEAVADVGGRTETSPITIDHLPGESSVDVSFGFSERPTGEIRVRVVSFTRP